MKKIKTFLSKLYRFGRTKWGIATLVILVLLGGYGLTHRQSTKQTSVLVTRGTITEAISVTGNTTPMQSVSLGFENNGTVARVYSFVGDHVYPGKILAMLNTGDLSAQLAQARANVDAQKAKLD